MMKKTVLFEAIGYADDKYLDMAECVYMEKTKEPQRAHSVLRTFPAVFAAVLLITVCTAVTFAMGLFSPLNGDDFTMSSTYEGDGRVTVVIRNLSDRDMRLSPELRLMKFYANEEVPASGEVTFSNTLIRAKETEAVVIDLSAAYDMAELERPLEDDRYCLLLTNNGFLFGHDWQCGVTFSESDTELPVYPQPVTALHVNGENGILPGLESFFETWLRTPDRRNENVRDYYAKVSALLSENEAEGIRMVSPSNPRLFVGKPPAGVVLDERVPVERQYQLILENHVVLDAYNIPVGASDMDACMVLGTCVPQRRDELSTPDGTMIPLVYVFQYAKTDMAGENDRVFVRGRLLSFAELESYKVYEDEKNVCYEVTELFYSDLDEHIGLLTADGGVYMDEGVRERLHNVYDYLTDHDNLRTLFYYQDELPGSGE